MKPNFESLDDSFYLVRTQAGFKQALRNEFADRFSEKGFNEMIKHHVREYPKSYPCIVSLTWGYNGADFFDCSCIHVNKLKQVLENC